MYLVFSQFLKSVDREDLVELYKLVKAKYGSTRPVKDMDFLLWGDLKTMFKPHVEDEIWKLQQSCASCVRGSKSSIMAIDHHMCFSKFMVAVGFLEICGIANLAMHHVTRV
ncbi:hypothetical protein Tco_0608544 [Tanacetum coccineum]